MSQVDRKTLKMESERTNGYQIATNKGICGISRYRFNSAIPSMREDYENSIVFGKKIFVLFKWRAYAISLDLILQLA